MTLDERMEERTMEYLADFLFAFGMTKRFTVGTLVSLKSLPEKVCLLEYFMMCVEHSIIPTKDEIKKATQLIQERITK